MMFSQKPYYFSQLSRSYPILKLVDIYDCQSFIRTYVLDNIYVCILMYILFYAVLWYANTVIKQIEKSNREMSITVAQHKTQLDRLVLLRNKKAEFEEAIVKQTDAQKVTLKNLESEMHRLSAELIVTSNKMAELEKMIKKYKLSGKTLTCPTGVMAVHGDEYVKGFEEVANSIDNFKILEPSFPPSVPPEPPPRKYGIFVSRPPGQRKTPSAVESSICSPKARFRP